MQAKLILPIIVILFAVAYGNAQQAETSRVEGIQVTTTHAILLGKTRPLSELIRQQPTSVAKRHKNRATKKRPANFINRRGLPKSVHADREHLGADPVRQADLPSGAYIEPLININGIGDGGSPLDPTGNVGENHYVQMVNATEIGIFSKSGELLESFAANTLWDEIDEFSAGDPIILYDQQAKKWIITEFTDPANLLIAVTENEDPFGSYYIYNFSTPEFPDYPKYAIWPEAIVVTTNEEGPGVLHHYFIQRAPLLEGAGNVVIQRVEVPGNWNTEAGFFVATPVDWNGNLLPENSAPLTLAMNDSSWGGVENDQIDVFRFHIDWETPANTVVEQIPVVTAPFDGYPCPDAGFYFACLPQKGGQSLDGIPEVIMNVPDYRNFGSHEAMVFSFITDVTDGNNLSGIRWVELRRDSLNDWYLFQEGSYAPEDGYHRFMSSIAFDGSGNIAMGFNVTSENDYVGIRFTGRFEHDPPGIMTVREYSVAKGQAPINSFSRFGDYAHISVDPVDDKTFWYTTEYAGEGNLVTQSRIVAFQMIRDSFDLSVSLIKPKSGKLLSQEEEVVVVVKNNGLESLADYTVDFSLNGILLESLLIPDTLHADSSRLITFEQKIDLSILGDYQISSHVYHPLDKYGNNNTAVNIVSHYPQRKIRLLAAEAPDRYCTNELLIKTRIENQGVDTIFSVDLDIYVNEVFLKSEKIGLSLPFKKQNSFELTLSGLDSEQQEITLVFTKINDFDEENQNFITINTVKSLALLPYIMEIKTDEYPEEISWKLFITGSSTPYLESEAYSRALTVEQTSICLVDTCYELVFYDQFGDGFCCEWGAGNYTLINPEGEVSLSGDGIFGYELKLTFCTNDTCNLVVLADVTHDYGQNEGTILLLAQNAEGPYQYSIDGGLTYSPDPLFVNLPHGTYPIKVLTADTLCFVTDSVIVELRSAATEPVENMYILNIYPNPNDGFFHVALEAPAEKSYWQLLQILDQTGRVLQEKRLSRYDDVYHSDISLVTRPAGIYYVRVWAGSQWLMRKIVKNE